MLIRGLIRGGGLFAQIIFRWRLVRVWGLVRVRGGTCSSVGA